MVTLCTIPKKTITKNTFIWFVVVGATATTTTRRTTMTSVAPGMSPTAVSPRPTGKPSHVSLASGRTPWSLGPHLREGLGVLGRNLEITRYILCIFIYIYIYVLCIYLYIFTKIHSIYIVYRVFLQLSPIIMEVENDIFLDTTHLAGKCFLLP